jgi:hypothetical protein
MTEDGFSLTEIDWLLWRVSEALKISKISEKCFGVKKSFWKIIYFFNLFLKPFLDL